MAGSRLSPGIAARLSRYLQVLTQTQKAGRSSISSKVLSDFSNINSTQIRRDLAAFGKFGKRGVGYDVGQLIDEIREIMLTSDEYSIALLGWGNLGAAIAGSDAILDYGFRIAAVFDIDPAKVGQRAGEMVVQHISGIKETVLERNIISGLLAVPAKNAAAAAKSLIDADVRIIFNFSDALLPAPPGFTIHSLAPAADMLLAMYNHQN
ncbi:MAG: redox-sensing transcriptional repressor Rex [Thermoleophilia bacterium]